MSRILLISFEYPLGKSYCGGVGQVVKQCRAALLDEGHKAFVLISHDFKKKYPVKLLLPDNSVIHYSSFYAFQKEYDWYKFSHIIHHFVNWAKELKRIKLSRGKRPRIIYHFHSILRRERDSGFKTFNNFLINQEKMIKIADKVICPSRYEYDNFIRYFTYFSEKIILIENTIETFPPSLRDIEKIKKQHSIEKKDIVSIFVGRLERIKGAEIVIDHVGEILKKHKLSTARPQSFRKGFFRNR